MAPDPTLAPPARSRPRRARRALLWAALIALLGVAQTLLLMLTVDYEEARAQESVELVAAEAAAEVRGQMLQLMQAVQALAWTGSPAASWRDGVDELLRQRPALRRIERRDARLQIVDSADTPFLPRLFSKMARADLALEAELACSAARRAAAPMFSTSYFVPLADGRGVEVVDLCVPVPRAGEETGFLVGSIALATLLDNALAAGSTRRHEFSFVEGDGTRLARSGIGRGAGVYVAERLVDLPGTTFQLRTDSTAGRPSLIPNLATALVLGLSLALFTVVLLLARDVRRRALAERALAEALAFRKAMEDSLSTGLRARDLQGRITYVNPAFCAMVGFTQDELRSPKTQLAGAAPYWPPEFVDDYLRRQAQRTSGEALSSVRLDTREGHESVFMRKSGERFPVMIYEAPLVDGDGRHTGWMSAALDLSAQRRVEELSRQQQDRLQATARLATVGEMASLLSHELNQPLAAIASYATGSLNLIDEAARDGDGDGADAAGGQGGRGSPDTETRQLLRQAIERIEQQAERAGRVIRSVHDFVRRREHSRETTTAAQLIDAVLPLARLQARKSGTRLEVELPSPAQMPAVHCDRTMVEQVLLNLMRNGIQAMETATPPADRLLTVRAAASGPGWVRFGVVDAGPGIAPDVAGRLFTPFFTTRPEGMGLGLSLCRTVIEQHGGVLDFGPGTGGRGTEFRFTLPGPRVAETGETSGSSITA